MHVQIVQNCCFSLSNMQICDVLVIVVVVVRSFDRNSRQASTFSINRALLVLFPVSYLSYPNLLGPSHETHLLAFPTLCLAFQQINLTPLQPIRSTQFADIFDSLPRPFSLYFCKFLNIRHQVNRVVAGSNTPIVSIRLRSSLSYSDV